MSRQSTSVTCHHQDGKGRECGGDLMFSHQLADEDRTCIYTCKKCGGRVEIT